jgi:hypothetical protein
MYQNSDTKVVIPVCIISPLGDDTDTNPENLIPKCQRHFDQDAKVALMAMQWHKDNLKALRPVVPIHREPELNGLIEFAETVQNLILDQEEPEEAELIRLGLVCLRCFPKTLTRCTRGIDD